MGRHTTLVPRPRHPRSAPVARPATFADVPVDLVSAISAAGGSGTPNPDTIRVVDAQGAVIDTSVAAQFDQQPGAGAGVGTLVVGTERPTPAGTTRRYHVYFDVVGSAVTPVTTARLVNVTSGPNTETTASWSTRRRATGPITRPAVASRASRRRRRQRLAELLHHPGVRSKYSNWLCACLLLRSFSCVLCKSSMVHSWPQPAWASSASSATDSQPNCNCLWGIWTPRPGGGINRDRERTWHGFLVGQGRVGQAARSWMSQAGEWVAAP